MTVLSGAGIALNEAALLLDGTYFIGQDLTGAEIGIATVDLQVVPLPAAFPLLLSGLAVLGIVARRRKTS
jgi:hypothetical protein